jgi:hypothetical protein
MRTLVLVLAVTAACKKPSTGDVTRDWFEDHRSSMTHVRDLMRADPGLVTSVGLSPTGIVRGATSRTNRCGSVLRGGEFPWKCEHGPDVGNVPEAEVALGLPPSRLREYGRALVAKQVDFGSPCIGPDTIQFTLADPESGDLCGGLRNVVAAKALPVWDAAKCPTTTTVYYEAIAPDGWYAQRCKP